MGKSILGWPLSNVVRIIASVFRGNVNWVSNYEKEWLHTCANSKGKNNRWSHSYFLSKSETGAETFGWGDNALCHQGFTEKRACCTSLSIIDTVDGCTKFCLWFRWSGQRTCYQGLLHTPRIKSARVIIGVYTYINSYSIESSTESKILRRVILFRETNLLLHLQFS